MNSTIWTEKYRPKEFSEIKGQKEIVKRTKAFVEQKNMPHLLFTGPAGVGKTTLALVICKQLFKDTWNQNLLELNASDERGIDIIRNKVKDFARTKAIGDVPFKIIYLDECDALTKEAQQALRRTMENYTQTTRFILSANYSSKIIDPIQSRCTLFRFKPLEKEDMTDFVINKLCKEGHEIEFPDNINSVMDALYEITKGDMRRVLNILQTSAAIDKKITPDLLFSIASVAKPKEIEDVIKLSLNGKFIEARNKLLDTMLKYGLSGIDIIQQIQQQLWDLDVDNKKKMILIEKCGEIEFRMTEGSDEFIQLEALLSQIALAKE